jgi:excisionase family DNA binding protein
MKEESPELLTMATAGDRESPRVRIHSLNFVPCFTTCVVSPLSADPVATGQASAVVTAVDEWWDVEQAAAYLKLKPKTIREGAAKGTLPGHKYPFGSSRGRWRFKAVELDEWLTRKPHKQRQKGQSVW